MGAASRCSGWHAVCARFCAVMENLLQIMYRHDLKLKLIRASNMDRTNAISHIWLVEKQENLSLRGLLVQPFVVVCNLLETVEGCRRANW